MIGTKSCEHECDCPCHESGKEGQPIMMHIMACCQKCTICDLMIVNGRMEDHLRDCHNQSQQIAVN